MIRRCLSAVSWSVVATLTACAPAYAVLTRTDPPAILYVADVSVMTAGAAIGLHGQYSRPRDGQLMLTGYGMALVTWATYWTGLVP